MSAAPSLPDAADPPIRLLSRRSFLLALAITLVIFFTLHPLWRPLDMDAMDRNIAWSYAPIPLLAAGLLALERKLRWASWLLETLRITLVKFAITFLFANLMWAIWGPPGSAPPESAPPAAESSSVQAGRFDVRPAPPATPLDPACTTRLHGTVVDKAGAPLPGALVAVTGGLEGRVFAPPADDVILSHDGSGFTPRRAILLTYEPLVVRGAPDVLHTVRAVDSGGRVLFNLALPPGGEFTRMFDRPLGRVLLNCAVHGQSDHAAELVVVDNPFAAFTDDEGCFSFDGVPEGELQLTASTSAERVVRLHVKLERDVVQPGVRITLD